MCVKALSFTCLLVPQAIYITDRNTCRPFALLNLVLRRVQREPRALSYSAARPSTLTAFLFVSPRVLKSRSKSGARDFTSYRMASRNNCSNCLRLSAPYQGWKQRWQTGQCLSIVGPPLQIQPYAVAIENFVTVGLELGLQVGLVHLCQV